MPLGCLTSGDELYHHANIKRLASPCSSVLCLTASLLALVGQLGESLSAFWELMGLSLDCILQRPDAGTGTNNDLRVLCLNYDTDVMLSFGLGIQSLLLGTSGTLSHAFSDEIVPWHQPLTPQKA